MHWSCLLLIGFGLELSVRRGVALTDVSTKLADMLVVNT